MTTDFNLALLSGDEVQKLESLYFMRANAMRKIDRLERAGSIIKIQTAWDRYETICAEIRKYEEGK